MGTNVASQDIQNTVRILNSIVNTVTNSSLQNISTTCQASNVLNAQFGFAPKFADAAGNIIEYQPCEINVKRVEITQIAEGTCSIEGGLTSDLNSTITNNLANAIEQRLQQELKQKNEFLALAINIAEQKGYNTTDISTLISTVISSNLSQTCRAFISASNNANVSYCGNYEEGIFIGQKGIANNLTSCMANNMLTNLSNNTIINDIAQSASQKASQTNEGLASLFKWLIIAAAVVGVLLIIGLVLYYILKPKDEDPLKAKKAKLAKLRQQQSRQNTIKKSASAPVAQKAEVVTARTKVSGQVQMIEDV